MVNKEPSFMGDASKYVNRTNLIIIAIIVVLISSGMAVRSIRRRVEANKGFPYDKVKQETGMRYVVLGKSTFYGTHFRAYSYDPTDESLDPSELGDWVDGFVDPLGGVHITKIT